MGSSHGEDRMTTPHRLHTTLEQFEALHRAADSRAETVRVPRQALINILMDHTKLSGKAIKPEDEKRE
jgi:hypothetical protein